MVSAVRRISTWLLLAGYLLSVTAAGSFHRHGDRPCSRSTTAGACQVFGGAWDLSGSASSGEEGCAVCQFLAQKVLPVQVTDAPVWTDVSTGVARVHPARAVAGETLLERSRAPPSAA